MNQNQFELHPLLAAAAQRTTEPPHWLQPASAMPAAVVIQPGQEPTWVAAAGPAGELATVADAAQAVAAFVAGHRRLKSDLALVALRDGILVNGVEALPLAVLAIKDALVLAPGVHSVLTERVRPYIGPPPDDLVTQKRRCSFCKLPLTTTTRIAICRCGAPLHHETEDSHPDLPEADRLRCVENVKVCTACSRPINLSEHLAWDPMEP